MELIGKIKHRKIYYLQIRNNQNWKSELPSKDWIAFTIANLEDEELIATSAKILFEKNVSYTCSAGEFGTQTEDYIDEEISWMEIVEPIEFVMTTSHKNFNEGFWFATTVAKKENYDLDKIVCLDFTKKKVKRYLKKLIEKINNNWIPSDNELESPKYDV